MKKETFIDCYLAVTFNDITNQFEADDQHLFGLRQSHIFKATTFKALEQEIIETYNNDHKLNKIGWYASASTLDIKLFYDFAKNLDLELDEVEMIFDYKGKHFITEKLRSYMDLDIKNDLNRTKELTNLLDVLK